MSVEFRENMILPVLPLRGMSVFRYALNFDVERPMSVAALNATLSADQTILLVAQREVTKRAARAGGPLPRGHRLPDPAAPPFAGQQPGPRQAEGLSPGSLCASPRRPPAILRRSCPCPTFRSAGTSSRRRP
jgi:hypothetical protein